MGKFSRNRPKGDLSELILKKEIESFVNMYEPSTMMQSEIEEFEASLESIKKDCEEIQCNFGSMVVKSIEYLQSRNSQFVPPECLKKYLTSSDE